MRLESLIKLNRHDLDTRTKLLAYYASPSYTDAYALKRRTAHCLWVVRNRPEAQIAGLPYCRIECAINASAYRRIKTLWEKQVRRRGNEIGVLANAAHFFASDEKRKAIALLKRLQRIEPANPGWHERLGDVYRLHTIGTRGVVRRNAAANALREWEAALALLRTGVERFYLLTKLAPIAVDAAQANKAVRYATVLRKRTRKYKSDWNHGNAIHLAHLTLGRVALSRGQIMASKKHLIASARVQGSPQLNSFGPNQTLAAELLAQGEVKTVIRYLELCRKFWEMGGQHIDAWIKSIRESGTTTFLPVY